MSGETLHRVRRADGTGLVALHRPAGQDVAGPTLVFLPGLRSDMTGEKATALANQAGRDGVASLRLDYSGHGRSDGRFEDGSLAVWRDDAMAVIDALAPGPVMLVGSSMGGWIALLLAQALGKRVRGLVGIAAAPDFTRGMAAALSPAQRAALDRDGRVVLPAEPEPLVLTRRALDDGEACCVMDGPIAIAAPVRLLHGQRDAVVPWNTALRIAERVTAADCRVTLVKDGDHRLSRPADLLLLLDTVRQLAVRKA